MVSVVILQLGFVIISGYRCISSAFSCNLASLFLSLFILYFCELLYCIKLHNYVHSYIILHYYIILYCYIILLYYNIIGGVGIDMPNCSCMPL